MIAILDDGSHLAYLERMDGTQKVSSRIAKEKGRTAILFRRPTKVLEDEVNGERMALLSPPGAVTVEGALPLLRKGKYLGAIGVSGVRSHHGWIAATVGVARLEYARSTLAIRSS